MMAFPEYILVASDRQVVNGVITQNYVFAFLSGQAIARKLAFSKRAKKKKRVYATFHFSRVYFYRCHPGDHWKPGEKLQC